MRLVLRVLSLGIITGILTVVGTCQEKADDTAQIVRVSGAVHLRSRLQQKASASSDTADAKREAEWEEFDSAPEVSSGRFPISISDRQPRLLRLRQRDVKQTWTVRWNDHKLGVLERNDADLVQLFDIPTEWMIVGENQLIVESTVSNGAQSDDIMLNSVDLVHLTIDDYVHQSRLKISIRDKDTGLPLPGRLTLVATDGSLTPLAVEPVDHLAARTGVVYTASGEAVISLPAGEYTVFAGRGFEYSLDQKQIAVRPGEEVARTMHIRRVVATEGYVACDPHVHTLTHSRHGDATLAERLVTIAGEGIEVPVAADHNLQIDYRRSPQFSQVSRYFSPIVGNEVTTPTGHFIVFPLDADVSPPDHRHPSWNETLSGLPETQSRHAVILNHPQDLHSGIRPFRPSRFHAASGELLSERWPTRLNVMEVVNSGATQSDPLQLFHNWMALLNRGHWIVPVGSSDSHDVTRYLVGQGRTYVRADDRDPGQISSDEFLNHFLSGHVLVSYGLLTSLTVDGKATSGDLVTRDPSRQQDTWQVDVVVAGPEWTRASRLQLYENGVLIADLEISSISADKREPGILWRGGFEIPRRRHDTHLVAIAIGPGIKEPYWQTVKPYQPITRSGQTWVLGCSGAVRLDNDGDGHWQSARELAMQVILPEMPRPSVDELLKKMKGVDRAVSIQVAGLWHEKGGDFASKEYQEILNRAAGEIRDGFLEYFNGWRAAQLDRQHLP